jgi:putative pyruvate formate lyase activating enzyme
MLNIEKSYLEKCILCPRKCRANRINQPEGKSSCSAGPTSGQKYASGGSAGPTSGQERVSGGSAGPTSGQERASGSSRHYGFCGEGAEIRAAFAGIHFGEEPCLCSSKGSGTVFFTGCTLKCPSCQNFQLSRLGAGRIVTQNELADIFLSLQGEGADNINLVTGTHFTPQIVSALGTAKKQGLILPVVWNTSGFEEIGTLELLKNSIDIYLTDIKTLDSHVAGSFFHTPRYPEVVKGAVLEMVCQCSARFSGEALQRGVIVRHLVLPGKLESTKEVLYWFNRELKGKAILSVMFQYTPIHHQAASEELTDTNRRISRKEYRQVIEWIDNLGLDEGYVQEYETDSNWLPDFTCRDPFPSRLCRTVWHYKGVY